MSVILFRVYKFAYVFSAGHGVKMYKILNENVDRIHAQLKNTRISIVYTILAYFRVPA